LNMDAPSDAEVTEFVLGTPSDPERPS